MRCLLDPNPLGDRPYRVTSYEKIPGSFFGNGVAQLVRDIQRVCNASARNLVKNMSYASGPITEVEAGRLADEEVFDEIIPYKVYFTSPDPYGGGHAAIKVNQIPSNATELMMVYEKFEAMADNKTGIPKLAYGPSGGQPRSLGVFTMQLANASKGIKNVLQNLEIDIIEPTVKAFWADNMLYDDDDTIKGDVKVIARGASGLLQKENLKAQQHESSRSCRSSCRSCHRKTRSRYCAKWRKVWNWTLASPDPAKRKGRRSSKTKCRCSRNKTYPQLLPVSRRPVNPVCRRRNRQQPPQPTRHSDYQITRLVVIEVWPPRSDKALVGEAADGPLYPKP